ncbi:site-specific DNA-methyltransferase [Peptococcaceae bacterium]|nr:site-specific DNA-methyltransferase [Peptococcaceae bacterium]
MDYFINKNAKEFLKEQFNIWLYQYVFQGMSVWTEKRIKQLQVLKDIAFKIIDFISQFEDELVKIWNKPKFVLNSNYVITLDRIAERARELKLIEKILRHRNFNDQVKEWKELGIVDNSFKKSKIIENDLTGKHLNKDYKHLPVDTRYFKDLELEILGLFDDLDNSLDGWLIKSENYQALNTILPKFKEKVQTIYIDPPFNKEQDADYFYSVKYKDASWITILENRLQLAKFVLNPKGSIFVRCDYNGNWLIRPLMNEVFGKENFRNEIAIKRGEVPKGEVRKLLTGTESLFYFSISNENLFYTPKKKRKKIEWLPMHLPQERSTYELQVREFFGSKLLPPKGRHWALSQKKIDEAIRNNKIRINKEKEYIDLKGNLVIGMPEILQDEYEKVDSNWTDIPSYTVRADGFKTENSEILLKRVIKSTCNEGDLVMDFFLGSGTTTAVAHKLDRKWLGVEMGEHFYTVVLPRMKKVLAYDKSGISKEKDVKEKYNQNNAGGFFKYYELEQYEDTLRKVKYEDADLFDNPNEDSYNQYVFMRDLKMLEALEVDYENNKIKVDLSKLYSNIDIPETLSNLLGKWIKRITPDSVEFEDGEKIDMKNLDYKLIKPLIWW